MHSLVYIYFLLNLIWLEYHLRIIAHIFCCFLFCQMLSYLIPCVRCLDFWTQWNKLWSWSAARMKTTKQREIIMVRMQCIQRGVCGLYELISCFVLVLDEILEEQRKHGHHKSASCTTKSWKNLQPQCHKLSNSQNHSLLSFVKSGSVIQPLSFAGLSAAPYSQLAINHQLFTHFSASNGQRNNAGASRTNKDDRSATLEGGCEFSELVNQERLLRLRKEAVENNVSEIHKRPGHTTVKSVEDPRDRVEATSDTGCLRASERVFSGRKVSKKHKVKWESERDHVRGMPDWVGDCVCDLKMKQTSSLC